MVEGRNLEVLQPGDGEVLVRLGQRLLLRFSSDDGRMFISVGSHDRPDAFVAIEYLAKLLGWIGNEEWTSFQQLEDEYIFTKDEGAEPPGPILPPHDLLNLVVENVGELERLFSGEKLDETRREVAEIVEDYLKPTCQEFSEKTIADRVPSY